MTITSILCPVDLSPVSGPVLRAALALARRESATVTVLHVLEPLLAQASAMAFDTPVLESMVAKDLDALIAESAEAAGLPLDRITRKVRLAEPENGILAAAEELDADLIVMGTRGYSGMRKLFFGSTASRVITRATRPVLALPPHAADTTARDAGASFDVTSVIAAVDFSESSMTALERAIALATHWRAPLTLLHVVEPVPARDRWVELLDEHQTRRSDRARRELDLLAREVAAVPVTVATLTGRAEEGIASLAERQPGSLIVIGLQRENGVKGMFRLGSTAYRLLSLTTQPVLIVPQSATARVSAAKAGSDKASAGKASGGKGNGGK